MTRDTFTHYGVRTVEHRPGFWDGSGGLAVIVLLVIAIVASLR